MRAVVFLPGATGRSYGTRIATRSASNAVGAPQVHQRLVEFPYGVTPLWQQPFGETPDVFFGTPASGRLTKDSKKHSSDVCIDRRCATPIRKAGDGASRVWPDSGKLLEGNRVIGDVTVVFGDDRLCEAVQVGRAAVIPQPFPRFPHALGLRPRQRSHSRKSFNKPRVVVGDSRHLRLLQHELRYQNAVGVPRRTPRQVSAFSPKPREQSARELTGVLRDTSTFRHTSRYHDGAREQQRV